MRIARPVRLLVLAGALATAGLAGCGGSSDSASIPGGADADDVRVIADWADALRAGDIEGASDFFAVPAVVENGTPPLRLTTRDEVDAFNRSLPCGAKLTEAETTGQLTIATFELTERPGAGECGDGVGETAKTAFAIEDGHIVHWLRVVDDEDAAPPSEGPVV
jgi:hypothetical protein